MVWVPTNYWFNSRIFFYARVSCWYFLEWHELSSWLLQIFQPIGRWLLQVRPTQFLPFSQPSQISGKSQILLFMSFLTVSLVWFSVRHQLICFYLKIPEYVLDFIVSDRFLFGHTPFGYMNKFQFLAELLVYNLPYPVMSSLILILS